MLPILVALIGIAVCIGLFGGVGPQRFGGGESRACGVSETEGVCSANGGVVDEIILPSRHVEVDRGVAKSGDARLVPSVAFFPNPVRDAVTFAARNICWCSVGGLRVTLYDASGGRVLEEITGAAILETDRISELPNGLYVAVFEISVGGSWTRTGRSVLGVLH